jgi:hypothetical protein
MCNMGRKIDVQLAGFMKRQQVLEKQIVVAGSCYLFLSSFSVYDLVKYFVPKHLYVLNTVVFKTEIMSLHLYTAVFEIL